MKLLQIPPDILDKVWPAVLPLIGQAVGALSDACTVESTLARIQTSQAQLWVMVEDDPPHKIMSVGVTSIIDYPTGNRALMLELLGGHNLKLWLELETDLEKWARANGCSIFYGWVRKGLAKHLTDSFRVTHFIVKKSLVSERVA